MSPTPQADATNDGAPAQAAPVEVSVVIPFKDEAPNVEPLLREVVAALDGRWRFEIIAVNDGSEDGTGALLDQLAREMSALRPLHHDLCRGQSAAVRSGVLAARAPLIATLDGDGQNPPDELPRLIEAALAADAPADLGLVAGQRQRRADNLGKRLSSRIANAIRRRLLNDGTRDTGCGLKAFRRNAYLLLPYFDHNHRFLPALMTREGFAVRHVDVAHRPRLAGSSKYTNLQRALVGIVDLLGVMWLTRRARGAKGPRKS